MPRFGVIKPDFQAPWLSRIIALAAAGQGLANGVGGAVEIAIGTTTLIALRARGLPFGAMAPRGPRSLDRFSPAMPT